MLPVEDIVVKLREILEPSGFEYYPFKVLQSCYHIIFCGNKCPKYYIG